MWNLIACSKLTEEKIQRKNLQLHKQKLRSMKAMMKIRQPDQPEFMYTKNKLQMSRRGTYQSSVDRFLEIERQNEILLKKMTNITEQHQLEDRLRPEAQNLKTLNQITQKKINEKIYMENTRICDKLLRVASYYPTTTIIDKTDELQRVRANISFNARRAKSARSLLVRPQSSYTTQSSKFYRTGGGKSMGKLQSDEKYITSARSTMIDNSRPESAPTVKRFVHSEKRKTEENRPSNKEEYHQKQIALYYQHDQNVEQRF